MKNLNRKEFEKMLKVCLNYIEEHPKNWMPQPGGIFYSMDHKQDQANIYLSVYEQNIELRYINPIGVMYWNLNKNDERLKGILKDLEKIKPFSMKEDDAKIELDLVEIKSQEEKKVIDEKKKIVDDPKPTDDPKPKESTPKFDGDRLFEVMHQNHTEKIYESDLTKPMSSGFASVFKNLQVGEEMFDYLSNTHYKRIK